ncbi:MAG: HAD-IB family hydrolase [Lentisphaeria bacterium]|nr:HAD-IB family hydrolase [Lentisphaeria bacterium]
MDHTLIHADCDVTWKSFAVRHGLAPESAIADADRFYEDYKNGCLDPVAFMRFQLAEFIGNTPAEMAEICRMHFEEFIRESCYPEALALVKELKAGGIPTAILTSTNTEIAAPTAAYFGVDELMGTRLAVADGRFTGEIAGEYAARAGKIAPARDFVARHGATLAETAYYGDSINDLDLLKVVGYPVAANPCPELRQIAEENNWRIVDFK